MKKRSLLIGLSLAVLLTAAGMAIATEGLPREQYQAFLDDSRFWFFAHNAARNMYKALQAEARSSACGGQAQTQEFVKRAGDLICHRWVDGNPAVADNY